MRPGRGVIAVVLALAALGAPAGVAQAGRTILVDRHGRPMHGRYASWIRQARAPLAGGRIRLALGACPRHPRLEACVLSSRPRRIYVSPRARTKRMAFYHELGHVYDLLVMSRAERRQFKRILRLEGRAWFRGPVPAAELFADGYARCVRYGPRHSGGRLANPTRSVYGYHPTLRQHRAVCSLIVRAAGPHRRPQPPPKPPPVFGPEPSAPAPPPAGQPAPPPERRPQNPLDLILGPPPG
jgi:hypothetical protein